MLFIIFMCLRVNAQSTQGVVFDEKSSSPIVGATVYFKGFSNSTVTDSQGRFVIQATNTYAPLMVSYVGYHSAVVPINSNELRVYLKQKIIELDVVQVRAHKTLHKEYLPAFTQEFLGKSKAAQSCIISNASQLNLYFDTNNKTLYASAGEPLIIENKMLGFKIKYFLEDFSSSPDALSVLGTYAFQELDTLSTDIKKNRESVYKGSKMHFIRSLVARQLQSQGFMISNRFGFTLKESDLLLDSLGKTYIKFPGFIRINYRNSFSSLICPNGIALIGNDGYFGADVSWSGDMSKARIGDLLPSDYLPETKNYELTVTKQTTNIIIKSSDLPTSVDTQNIKQQVLAIDSTDSSLQQKMKLIKLKDIKVLGKQTVVLRDGMPYMPYGRAQVFNITQADAQYKTLLWFILQNIRGAQISSDVDLTGVVFNGIKATQLNTPSLEGNNTVTKMGYGGAPPALFVNGIELSMDDPQEAELHRKIYFNMPISSFKRITLQRFLGMTGDRFVLYLTLDPKADSTKD